MKRFFAFAVSLMLLTGCVGSPKSANPKATENLEKPFVATAKLNYKDVKSTLVLDRGEPKSYTITFTEPPSVKDMKLVFTKENVNISYNGIGFSVKHDDFTDGAAGKMLIESLETAIGKENLIITTENGSIHISGITDNGEFVLTIDEKTGNFLSVKIPDSDFYMEFSEFEFY